MSDTNTEQALSDLLDATINTKEVKTKSIPIPEGLYPATITSYDIKTYAPKEAGKLPSVQLLVHLTFNDPELPAIVEMDEVKRTHRVWLNRNEDGSLSMNNIGFGRLLEAVGKHEMGESPLTEILDELPGSDIGVKVINKPYEDRIVDDIKDVVSIEDVV